MSQPEATLRIDVRPGDPATVTVAGELDLSTAAQLQGCVERLLGAGHRRIVVRLDQLTFCDSTGLTTFVRGNRDCTAAGGWLRLAGARGHVARVIDISGLTDALLYRP